MQRLRLAWQGKLVVVRESRRGRGDLTPRTNPDRDKVFFTGSADGLVPHRACAVRANGAAGSAVRSFAVRCDGSAGPIRGHDSRAAVGEQDAAAGAATRPRRSAREPPLARGAAASDGVCRWCVVASSCLSAVELLGPLVPWSCRLVSFLDFQHWFRRRAPPPCTTPTCPCLIDGSNRHCCISVQLAGPRGRAVGTVRQR
jgi:hypothetical protein